MSIADTSQRPLTRDAEPSPHVVPAGTRALLATLMDVLAALVPLLAVPLLGRTRLPLACAWTSAGVLVILVAAALIADLCRTGRTPGRRLLGVRTVAAATGLPPTLREVVRRQLSTADLRAGRDPLRLVPAGARPLEPAGWTGWRQSAADGTGQWQLLLDNGVQVALTGSSLVGRDPTNEPGQSHQLLAVPDLTRSISRVHALLEPDADCVWLTDTGATNGTRAATPSAAGGTVIERWLRPGERVAVRAGSTIHLGDRALRLSRSNHPEA
ncbi:MAG: FHA domain-containing protein [Micropruina sp.]|nr:FHA domain-containing protein [Micropruina sp.]